MKWYRRLFLFSLLLSLIPLGPAAANQETIRITTGQWPPYLDENRPDGGFLAQIIREAFASQDIDVEFSFFPWSRALALVKSREYQASAVWSFRKLLLERIDLFPMDPIVGEAMLAEQLGPEARESLEFHPRPLRSALYHLPFSREDPEAGRLKRAFDRGLAKLRESGRYQEIIEKALKAHSSPAAAEILEDKLVNWDEDPSTCD